MPADVADLLGRRAESAPVGAASIPLDSVQAPRLRKGFPDTVARSVYYDPLLAPRDPTEGVEDAYEKALGDLDADVVKRFASQISGNIMSEQDVYRADELLLNALYARVHKKMRPAAPPASAPTSLLGIRIRAAPAPPPAPAKPPMQTPWGFFMEYGHNTIALAMRKGWEQFVEEANAVDLRGKQNEVMEHDDNWEAFAAYVRAVIIKERQSGLGQHPTGTQILARLAERSENLFETRRLMVRLGLRNPDSVQNVQARGTRVYMF